MMASTSLPAPREIDTVACLPAAGFIGYWEGFISYAKWDVNAYRTGFGSDTEGPDQTPVTKATTTTRERALQNLAVRIPQYVDTARKQLGDLWDKLGVSTQVAVIDICYNYGDLPDSVLFAFLHNSSGVASAIRLHESDNKRINADRRAAEAGLVIFDGGQF